MARTFPSKVYTPLASCLRRPLEKLQENVPSLLRFMAYLDEPLPAAVQAPVMSLAATALGTGVSAGDLPGSVSRGESVATRAADTASFGSRSDTRRNSRSAGSV